MNIEKKSKICKVYAQDKNKLSSSLMDFVSKCLTRQEHEKDLQVESRVIRKIPGDFSTSYSKLNRE